MSLPATTCAFEHPAFGSLHNAVFRLTEGDHIPALAIEMDGSVAVVPLNSIAKLFTISADSADGRMLNMIGSALRFVVSLRLGDKLPTEVLSGKASWQPSPYHRQAAFARLQLQLLAWLGASPEGREGPRVTAAMLVADDPAAKPLVQEAFRRAANELGIAGGGPAVATLLEELAAEVAYIEALRERLLERVVALHARLTRLGARRSIPAARRETLTQVVRLVAKGLAEISARFTEADAQTDDILPVLRDLDGQRSSLRPRRDWLYCTQLAWDAELREWDTLSEAPGDEGVWRLVDRLYRFIAPRFMNVQEWAKADTQIRADRKPVAFVW